MYIQCKRNRQKICIAWCVFFVLLFFSSVILSFCSIDITCKINSCHDICSDFKKKKKKLKRSVQCHWDRSVEGKWTNGMISSREKKIRRNVNVWQINHFQLFSSHFFEHVGSVISLLFFLFFLANVAKKENFAKK